MTYQERLALLYLFVLLCGFFQANNWSLEIVPAGGKGATLE